MMDHPPLLTGESRGLAAQLRAAKALSFLGVPSKPFSGEAGCSPRVLVIAAHPDDEVVGAGSRLRRLAGNLVIVHTTDGSPRNLVDAWRAGCQARHEYAELRRRELFAALQLAGVESRQARSLSFIDQELSSHMVELTGLLLDLLRSVGPDVILTHPYEGGHPDHDATAFAVHAALRILEREAALSGVSSGAGLPTLLEMTSYHNDGGRIRPYDFLPGNGNLPGREGLDWVVTAELSTSERSQKQQMLDCFASQRETLACFPNQVERFRVAPEYDFTRPPMDGSLFYELFDWGMSGPRWRELATASLATLNLARKDRDRP